MDDDKPGTPLEDGKVSSKLAQVCVAVAEKQAMFALRGEGRAKQAMGPSGGGGEHDTGTAPDFTAGDLAGCLSGLATAHLCGGEQGSADAAVKSAVRAVHVCPGEGTAWRCLAAALVSACHPPSRGKYLNRNRSITKTMESAVPTGLLDVCSMPIVGLLHRLLPRLVCQFCVFFCLHDVK